MPGWEVVKTPSLLLLAAYEGKWVGRRKNTEKGRKLKIYLAHPPVSKKFPEVKLTTYVCRSAWPQPQGAGASPPPR